MPIPHYYAGIMWTTLEAGHKRKIPRKHYTTGSALPCVSFALVAFLLPRIIKRQPAWSIDQELSINKSIIKYNQELSHDKYKFEVLLVSFNKDKAEHFPIYSMRHFAFICEDCTICGNVWQNYYVRQISLDSLAFPMFLTRKLKAHIMPLAISNRRNRKSAMFLLARSS